MMRLSAQSITLAGAYLLALSLPLAEAPKQAGLWLCITAGMVWLWQSRPALKPDVLTLSLAGLVLSGIISAGLALEPAEALGAHLDVIRAVLLFVVMRSLPLTPAMIHNMLMLLGLSLLLAFGYGLYEFYALGGEYLELHSVGHINHSALYMLLMLSLALSRVFFHHPDSRRRLVWILTAGAALAGIFIGGSRAAMFCAAALILLLPLFSRGPWRWLIPLTGLAIGVAIVMFSPYTREKILLGLNMQHRWPLLHAAWLGWLDSNWWFGIGADHSHYLKLSDFPQVAPSHFVYLPHAHNTYMTYLLERGLAGLGFYLLFLAALPWRLVRKTRADFLVYSALLIWGLNVTVSLVNTTFHNENGLLMMWLWGLALNGERGGGYPRMHTDTHRL